MLCSTWKLCMQHTRLHYPASNKPLLCTQRLLGAQDGALDACGLAATELTVVSVRTAGMQHREVPVPVP